MIDETLKVALRLAEEAFEQAEDAVSEARLNLANYHIDAGTVGDRHPIEIDTRWGRTTRDCTCFYSSWHTEEELPWVLNGKRVDA